MSTNFKTKHPIRNADNDSGFLRTLMSVIGLSVILSATLILSSGRLDWVMAWVYIGIRVSLSGISIWMISIRYPGLWDERFHPRGGAKNWDKPLSSITTLLFPISLIVAGLDKRFG